MTRTPSSGTTSDRDCHSRRPRCQHHPDVRGRNCESPVRRIRHRHRILRSHTVDQAIRDLYDRRWRAGGSRHPATVSAAPTPGRSPPARISRRGRVRESRGQRRAPYAPTHTAVESSDRYATRGDTGRVYASSEQAVQWSESLSVKTVRSSGPLPGRTNTRQRGIHSPTSPSEPKVSAIESTS